MVVLIAYNNSQNNGGGNSDPDPADAPTNITGEFIRWEAVDDENGYAYIEVTNHGSSTAVAECTVSVRNEFGDFGFDYMVGESIPAGETYRGRMAINVGEGSFLIDQGEVTDC